MIFKLFILSVLLFSCSHQNKSRNSHRSHYSSETEMEFEQIERTKTIETYRKMRMERYKKEKNPNYIPKKIALPKRKRSIRKKRVTRKKRVSKKYKKVDADELNAEIGQHLSYYCMKNRKSSKFKNRTPCETRTQQINDNCSTKFQADNRKRLYCVKKALK